MSKRRKGFSLSCLSEKAQAQALAKIAAMDAPAPVITPAQAEATSKRLEWWPYRNKTEWRFAKWLADRYPAPNVIAYEPMKFSLGAINGKQSWYMPDFVVQTGDTVQIFEVKGGHRFREKGIERLRNAASRWPAFGWWLVEPNGQGWKLKRVEG